jgi:hypothetical protein
VISVSSLLDTGRNVQQKPGVQRRKTLLDMSDIIPVGDVQQNVCLAEAVPQAPATPLSLLSSGALGPRR